MLSWTWRVGRERSEKGRNGRNLKRYMKENYQGDCGCKDMMGWKMSTKSLRILIYTIENKLSTFIEIGNTG